MAKNQITPFGQRVTDALKKKGLIQRNLAEKLGVTNQFLYNILYGKRTGTKHLPVIAEFCGISLEPDTEDIDQTGESGEESKEPVDKTGSAVKKTPKRRKKQRKQQKQKETHEFTPFGLMVVEALDQMGMKQVDLAREIGTGKQYLYMILHGQRSGRKYLSKIAQICEIDLEVHFRT